MTATMRLISIGKRSLHACDLAAADAPLIPLPGGAGEDAALLGDAALLLSTRAPS
jgi:hypothetical protein